MLRCRFARLLILGACFTFGLVAPSSHLLAQSCNPDQLGGVIFRDYNSNGTRESLEPGQAGVTVRAFDSDGELLGTTSSGDDGTYLLSSISNGSEVRVEFSNLPSYLRSGPVGGESRSSVQFVTSTGGCDVDFGVASPAEYCQEEPLLMTPCYVNGDPLLNGTAASSDAFVAWPYSEDGRPLTNTAVEVLHWSLNEQTGPTWGVAVQRSSQTVFTSAIMKRHSGFGPLGTGGIYAIDVSDPENAITTPFLDLAALGINTGADPHAGVGADITTPSLDAASYGEVGKISFGDLDISEDEETLFLMNLADRTLYGIHIGVPATVPTLADVTDYPIPNPGCPNNDYRPWGIGVHDGEVYIGVVCTGEISEDNSDLKFYVQQLQEDGSFLTVVEEDLDYQKGFPIRAAFNPLPGVTDWQHWADNFTLDVTNAAANGSFISYPQPLLSDIEFDSDGSMILGFLDRSGHQLGRFNFIPTAATFINPPSAGDLLRACRTGSNIWQLESNGTCPGGTPTDGAGNSEGPGGGEYYFADSIPDFFNPLLDAHQELVVGGLVHYRGSGEVVASVYDPFEFETGGTITFSNSTGNRVRGYEVFPPFLGNLGKAAGVGDLEVLCDPAPIEIGNRVWLDSNENGEQDAAEAVFANVCVTLTTPAGDIVASTTTDENGEYLFTEEDGVEVNTDYLITLNCDEDYAAGGPLAGYLPTTANSGESQRDSDGVVVNGFPRVEVTTGPPGENNHTYDFGFREADCTPFDSELVIGTMDGLGARLLSQHRLVVGLRKRNRERPGCETLSRKSELKSIQRARASYDAIWQASWGELPRVQYRCNEVVPACTTTDITPQLETISTETNTLYREIKKLLTPSCLPKKRKGRYTRNAKRLVDEVAELALTLDNPSTECSFDF